MAIVHKLGADGSFTAGDTETRLTSYAYPTSTYATQAKRKPDAVAAEMTKAARRFADLPRADYDARNWARLEG